MVFRLHVSGNGEDVSAGKCQLRIGQSQGLQSITHVSYSLNSLKGGDIGDSIGGSSRGLLRGGTWRSIVLITYLVTVVIT